MPTQPRTESPAPALHALGADAALSRRAAWIGWGSSVLAHFALAAVVIAVGQSPDYGFEFDAPAELELGMTDAVEVEAMPAVPAAPPEPAPEPVGTGEAPGASAMDAGVAAPSDGGVPTDAPRRRRPDAAVEPDGGAAVGNDGVPSPVAFLPAGGQIALRMDLDRVRASPVRDDVVTLLAAIPDWQALLGDSAVDPVRDLSRVLVATPNLQRSSLVVAGRLASETEAPDRIVERMVEAGGGTVAWEQSGGARSTDWPSPDATTRRVAIVGERHFVIARPQDLPRVLAIAAARAGAEASDSAADALLALPEGAVITIEIEGARAYMRRSPCVVPTRIAARIDERERDVGVSLHALFDTEDESRDAERCFESLRARAMRNPFVTFAGMGGPLGGLEITTDGATLDAHTQLSYGQIRTLLRYVQGMLRRPPPLPSGSSSETTPAGVTPVPPPGVTPVPPPPPVTPVPPPPPPVTPVPPPPVPPPR